MDVGQFFSAVSSLWMENWVAEHAGGGGTSAPGVGWWMWTKPALAGGVSWSGACFARPCSATCDMRVWSLSQVSVTERARWSHDQEVQVRVQSWQSPQSVCPPSTPTAILSRPRGREGDALSFFLIEI